LPLEKQLIGQNTFEPLIFCDYDNTSILVAHLISII